MTQGPLEQKRYWIALNMIPNLTPKKFHILLDNFSSPEEIWHAPFEKLKEIPGFSESTETFCAHRARLDVDQELAEIEKHGLKVITLMDEAYPKALRSIDTPPPVLYLKGDYIDKDELAISIVGTRRPTSYGRLVAEKLAKELGERGFTIVSGMALGIDTVAHRGALEAGARTIAVLGSGFKDIYPRENVRLMEEIARSGCVMSEFSLFTKPDKWTFPQRNRIIGGLSRGTIIVEAPEKSGALITARLALEQGREVFAVPGNITSEASRGTNKLIKDGAKLIENIDDVLEEFRDLKETLAGLAPRPPTAERPALSPLEEQIFKLLNYEPIHFNDVVEKSALSPSQVSFALLQLMMKSLVKELEGKRYAKLP